MVACNRKETFHLHRVEHRFFFKKSDRIFGQVFHCGGIFRTVAAFFALSGGSKDVNRSDQLIMALTAGNKLVTKDTHLRTKWRR